MDLFMTMEDYLYIRYRKRSKFLSNHHHFVKVITQKETVTKTQ